MLFRWRRYDAAPGATVSVIPDVREVDGPADTFRINVSSPLEYIHYIYIIYIYTSMFPTVEYFAIYIDIINLIKFHSILNNYRAWII